MHWGNQHCDEFKAAVEKSNGVCAIPFGWIANYPNAYSADLHCGVNERIAKTVEGTAKTFKFLREETVSEEYQKQWLAKRIGNL